MRDTSRQVITVLAFLLTMTVNVASNALPINGQRPGDISDRFAVLVIPAGYVFAIWGLIYLFLGAFTTWQALPRNRRDDTLRSLGLLPALTGVLNATWLVLFHYEQFPAALVVMVGLLATLVAIHLRLWARRDTLTRTERWVVRVPFSIYLGWITVATIANTAQTLAWLGVDGVGIDPALIGAAVLLVGLAIAGTFVWRFRDAAYGLVIVWAYVGVVVKESETAIVAVVAGVGAVVIGVLVLSALARRGETDGSARGVSSPVVA